MSNKSSSERLTSLLPTNIKGGLLGGLNSKKKKLNENDLMPPPPPKRKSENDAHDNNRRNYRKRVEETPSHVGINRDVERKVRDKEGKRRRHRRDRYDDYSDDSDDDDYDSDDDDRRSRSRRRSSSSKKSRQKKEKSRKKSKRRSRSRSRSPNSSDDSSDYESDRKKYSSSSSRRRGSSKRHEKDDREYDDKRSSSSRRRDQDNRSRDSERREDLMYASTPMLHQRGNRNDSNYNHHQGRGSGGRGEGSGGGRGWNRNHARNGTNRSSWENETPINNRNNYGRPGTDRTEDIIKRSTMSSSSAAVVSQSSNSSRGRITSTMSRNQQYRGRGIDETPMRGDKQNGRDQDNENNNNNVNQDEFDEEFDRQFYLDDEGIQDGGGGGGDNNQMGRFLFESEKTKAREEEMRMRKHTLGNAGSTMRDARRNALRDDQEAWEENRLLSSGAAVRGDVDIDKLMNGSENDSRVTLLVHQVKPPFLKDGASAFSKVRTAVATVKDNTSDFAKMAREGSVTLRSIREKKEKNAMRQKFWELGGTRIGNAIKSKEESKSGEESKIEDKENASEAKGEGDINAEEERANESVQENVQGEVDYKKSSGFAAHVTGQKKENDGPVSEFAKKKSIRQQREYLPAFTIREELLNVVRENNIIIVVGETGSG